MTRGKSVTPFAFGFRSRQYAAIGLKKLMAAFGHAQPTEGFAFGLEPLCIGIANDGIAAIVVTRK